MIEYLRVPLLGRAPKKVDFQYLLEQVKRRLATWKSTQLSFAGRVTLSKAVVEALPIYAMMSNPIPKAWLGEI